MPKHSMFKHPSMNTTMADRLTMIVADITAAETVSDTPGGYDKIREEHTCGILLAYCVSTAAVIQKKRGRAHLDEIQGRQRLASFPRNGAEDGHRRVWEDGLGQRAQPERGEEGRSVGVSERRSQTGALAGSGGL